MLAPARCRLRRQPDWPKAFRVTIQKTVQICRQRLHLGASHERHQIERMFPDITYGPGPGTLGTGAPVGLLVPGGFGKPILCVFHMNDADIAKIASDASAARLIACACSCVAARGLSKMTWITASKNAATGPACMWFGVTIATASMPSPRAAHAVAIALWLALERSPVRPQNAPQAQDRTTRHPPPVPTCHQDGQRCAGHLR